MTTITPEGNIISCVFSSRFLHCICKIYSCLYASLEKYLVRVRMCTVSYGIIMSKYALYDTYHQTNQLRWITIAMNHTPLAQSYFITVYNTMFLQTASNQNCFQNYHIPCICNTSFQQHISWWYFSLLRYPCFVIQHQAICSSFTWRKLMI